MAKNLTMVEKIAKARQLIQKARDLPLPAEGGRHDYSYIAKVKDILRQARDLVKFIPLQPSATLEIKEEVQHVLAEADQANREILLTG